MNIGIDLDGVVFDTETYFRAYADLYDLEINGGGLKDKSQGKVQNRFAWSKEHMDNYLYNYVEPIEEEAPFMPLVKIVLKKLKELGHKLIVISSRGIIDPNGMEIANRRFQEEGLEFDKILSGQESKLEFCKHEKIDVMIDDLYEHIDYLSNNGIKCFYFRSKGMKKVDRENVIEVDNWAQILKEIINMTQK
ncbi:MAG: hypothetical protein IJ008_00415 [Clostridia bacterium]|nr:hypothetical protein [Clostridia bacterium]